MPAALIVDADPASEAFGPRLAARGIRSHVAATLGAAISAARDDQFDVVIVDPDAAGTASPLGEIVKSFGEVPVVVVATGGAKRAVEAMRSGAADYIEKPIQEAELLYVLDKVLTTDAVAAVEAPVPEGLEITLLGQSKATRQVIDLVQRIAPTNATVLVRGESGTGKELVARAIHAGSPRRDGPFVKVHCAGLPETLLESELFGYERGAFTGATSRKPGRVEVAEGGTLFLDEIGDINAAMQVKLLRLLQDREYERLGGATTLRADVRFVAATHRDLEHMIKEGTFREDLFYRLNVVPVWLPPLRARRGDVALLATYFCEAFAQAHGKRGTTLSEEAVSALSSERWPGNVRQLQNFIERLVVLAQHTVIEVEDVQRELAPQVSFMTDSATKAASITALTDTREGKPLAPLDATLRDAEKKAIERALRHAKGNRALAARLLGIGRATLYHKLEELGLGRREP